MFLIDSEILIGVGGLNVGSGLTISGTAPARMVTAGGTPFLSSISTLITNEYFSKLKIRYIKLKDWINVTTLLYEKVLKESMIDKRIDEKEVEKLRSNYNLFINNQDEIKRSAQFRVEEDFRNIIPKCTFSPEQITKLNNFLAKTM